MKSQFSHILGWLLISTISAHAIPTTTVNDESDAKVADVAAIQGLLEKADGVAVHQVLYTINPHERHQKNQPIVSDIHNKEYQQPTQDIKLAKRQEESAPRNNTIVVSPSTTTIPTTPESVSSPPLSITKSIESPPPNSPTTSIEVLASLSLSLTKPTESVDFSVSLSTATVAASSSSLIILASSSTNIASGQLPTISSTPGPSTSTITLPPESSTTIVIVSNPQSSPAINAVPSTTELSQAVPTSAESRTVTSANSGPGTTVPGTTSAASSVIATRTSSSPNGSTRAPNAASSITTGSSQTTTGPSNPEVVLVTSTLADGQVVTQTSYVGAATAAESQGSPTSAPAGALQSPSAAHHDHPPPTFRQWLLIAYATCFIFTIAL